MKLPISNIFLIFGLAQYKNRAIGCLSPVLNSFLTREGKLEKINELDEGVFFV